jgi:hypothetical protein
MHAKSSSVIVSGYAGRGLRTEVETMHCIAAWPSCQNIA